MLNILSISTLFPTPGMEHHGVFVKNRLNAMAQIQDVNITVINPLPSSPIHRLFSKYDGLKNVPKERHFGSLEAIYHVKFFSLPKLAKTIEATFLERKLSNEFHQINMKHGPFDVIDVHWSFPDLPVAISLAKCLNIPCVMTLRGMEAFYLDDNDRRRDIIAKSLTEVDHIISLSQEMADYANKIANTKSKTTIIRNGVDTDTFTYIDQLICRARCKIPENQNVILGVGALIERKGFHHVIDAIFLLNNGRSEKPYHYYILGSIGMEGDYGKELHRKIEMLELSKNIHFVGKVDNDLLPVWYNAADIFCLSSSGEGSPNVLTEALSCGTVSVATSVGAVPDIMNSEHGLGVMVEIPHHDIQSFPSKICNAILEAEKITVKKIDRSASMKKYTWLWCAEKAHIALMNVKGLAK